MKKDTEVEKCIIVNKENFNKSLKEFKKNLDSNLLNYVVINNDISTTTDENNNKLGEIVYSEFTVCRRVNTSNDIDYRLITFLIPSLKFHRYTNDEIISFNILFLKYLSNQRQSYNINKINNINSLSYENINKKKELENNLNSILKDGKAFKKENKTSYNYYPKAFELPSKKYQKQIEKIIKYFTLQFIEDKDEKKYDKNNANEDTPFEYNSEIYESNYKLVLNLLDFRWINIYKKIENEMIKLVVDGLKIQKKTKNVKLNEGFQKFLENLKKYFTDTDKNKNEEDSFKAVINNDKGLLDKWAYYLDSEGVLKFSFQKIEENTYEINILANKNSTEDNYKIENNGTICYIDNICKLLSAILDINSEKEIIALKGIKYHRFNLLHLFPEELQKDIELSYHILQRIDPIKSKSDRKDLNRDECLNRISYRKLFMNVDNEEEILFGYQFRVQLDKLLRTVNKDDKDIKTISLELGNDLRLLLEYDEFKKIKDNYFECFDVSENVKNGIKNNFNEVNYHCIKNQDNNDLINDLVKSAKKIKKQMLIDEEIGITNFYLELFKKQNIRIYGTNLYQKLQFVIKNLLLIDCNEEKFKEYIDKLSIYDLSFICKNENIDFFQKYTSLKHDKTQKIQLITQRLAIIINENTFLKDKDKIQKYKNSFYAEDFNDESKEKCIEIDKNFFYENIDKIFEKINCKTDFIIQSNKHKIKFFIIDKEKYGENEKIKNDIINIK